MIRGAVFDLDGVLLDSMAIWNDLGARYLQNQGIQPEPDLREMLFSMSMEQGAEYMKQQYHLKQSVEEVLAGIQEMLQDYYFYEVKAKDGARELLAFLQEKGIKMTAATSSPREHVTRALRRNGLLEFLQKIDTTSEVGESKHSPLIYRLAAEYMGTRPEETLVFEDSLYALQTAKQAGFRAIGVYDGNGETNQDGVKETGEVYLKDLAEFPGVFEKLK